MKSIVYKILQGQPCQRPMRASHRTNYSTLPNPEKPAERLKNKYFANSAEAVFRPVGAPKIGRGDDSGRVMVPCGS